jgi:hypothetical protein
MVSVLLRLNLFQSLSNPKYQDLGASFRSHDDRLSMFLRNVRPWHKSQDSINLLSSFRYRRHAVCAFPASKSDNERIAYGVASVFTPERNRRKGYAQHMMRLLHYVLTDPQNLPPFPIIEWGEPPQIPEGFGNAIASALHSDVGHFYSACGPSTSSVPTQQSWNVTDPYGTLWDVPSDIPEDVDEHVEWVDDDKDLNSLWLEDEAVIHKEFANEVKDKTLFSFLPARGVTAFQHRRSMFYAPAASNGMKWGLRLRYTDAKPLQFATWTIDPDHSPPTNLVITRLRSNATSFPKLLHAIFKFASDNRLKTIEVWNLDPQLAGPAMKFGGLTELRSVHLPALAWYGAGEVEWRHNEKFCWC